MKANRSREEREFDVWMYDVNSSNNTICTYTFNISKTSSAIPSTQRIHAIPIPHPTFNAIPTIPFILLLCYPPPRNLDTSLLRD